MGERGFRADVHDVRALRRQNFSALNRRFRRQADAFAIPRIGREIDDAHDGGLRVEIEFFAADGKFLHARGRGGAVFLQQFRQLFEVQHGRIVNRKSRIVNGKWRAGQGRLELDNFRRLRHSGGVEKPPILQPPPAAPRKRKRGLWIAVLAVLLVAAALVIVVVIKRATPPITVQTTKVSRHSITNLVVANGQIQPVVQVTISPEVSGEITELPVKEGQFVHKGDLLLKINPDVYTAGLSQAKAGYESSLATKATAVANLEKAEADFKRNKELSDRKLLSDSDFIGFKVARDVAQAQLESANDQVDVAKAAVDNAQDLLDKTTIVSPLDGTITLLSSQLGERVLGTVQNAGTDIMIISDLSQIEARVNVGEMDVVSIASGQQVRLEVDAFKDRKFTGVVTNVANSAVGSAARPPSAVAAAASRSRRRNSKCASGSTTTNRPSAPACR